MAQFEFKLPDIGEGVVEGEIVKWLVKAGDEIVEDQPLVEVMTDKATVTIPSPRKGKVLKTVGNEGDVAKVHGTLVVLEVAGSGPDEASHGAPTAHSQAQPPAVPKTAPGQTAAAPAQPAKAPATAQAAPSIPHEKAGQPAALSSAPGPAAQQQKAPAPAQSPPAAHDSDESSTDGAANGRKVLATPVTRRMARELGVDLAQLEGSGPQGRVMKADLIAHADKPAAPQPAQAQPSGKDERIPLRGLRKRISEAMVKSKFTAPHFTFVEECDTAALTRLRASINAGLAKRGDAKLTYLPFIAKALVHGFKKFPHLNSVVDEATRDLIVKHEVNLGIGAATEQGLTVFVVRDVANLSLRQIGAEIDRLAKAAREQKLKVEELRDGTFTITSLGKDGGLLATPIIHHPEVAILGVHRLQERPVVVRDEHGKASIEIGERMNFSCSFDHRYIDGHIGAQFLYEMIRALEAPELMLASS